MDGTDNVVYFDSCIWITWIKDGEGDNLDDDVLPSIEGMLQLMQRRELTIISSAVAICEVLDCDLSQGILNKIGKWDSQFLRIIDVDMRISMCTRELRRYYCANRHQNNDKELCTPDAIHIATAVLNDVPTFYTLDERDKKNCRGLTKLSGKIADKWDLVIKKPDREETELPLFKEAQEES